MLSNLVGWFGDPAHWTGPGGVPVRLLEHLLYTLLAVGIAALIAVPLGAWIGHTGRGGLLVVGTANGMRALPELGLLTLLVLLTSIGLLPVTLALVVLAIPALLAGTYAGVRNVDRAAVDAARGMGMSGTEILTKVELPNALPLIIGGLRAATLQVIATAAIAAYVALGGLGRYLIDGLAVTDYPQVIAGAVLVAALALIVEGLLALLQRVVVSPGLRRASRRRARRTGRSSSPRPGAVPRAVSEPVGGRR